MNRQKGFTLIELSIMVVLLSILAVFLAPRIQDSLTKLRLNSATQKLVADIRYARELALSHHTTYGIQFSVANNSYQLFKLVNGVGVVITDPHTGGSLITDFDDDSAYQGVSITTIMSQEIRFDSFGTPMDQGNNAFTQANMYILQNLSAGQSKTIRVTNQTGFTEIV